MAAHTCGFPVVEDNVKFERQLLNDAPCLPHLLAEQPREQQREQLVGDQVEEPHRPALHRVHEPGAVDHLSLPPGEGGDELGNVLGRYSHVGVEDQHDLALHP